MKFNSHYPASRIDRWIQIITHNLRRKKSPRLMNKFLPQYSPKGPAGKFTTILVYIPNSIREEKKTPYYSDHQICLNQFWGQGRLKLLLLNVSGVWVTYFLQNYNTKPRSVRHGPVCSFPKQKCKLDDINLWYSLILLY